MPPAWQFDTGELAVSNTAFEDPDYITIREACRIIGGNRPINVSTYYRNANAGKVPPVEHPVPGISRVSGRKLRAMITARAESATPAHNAPVDAKAGEAA
jgi:hypothetical protein